MRALSLAAIILPRIAIALALAWLALPAAAQNPPREVAPSQQIEVAPAGRVNWKNLVRADAPRPARQRVVAPFRQPPEPRKIGAALSFSDAGDRFEPPAEPLELPAAACQPVDGFSQTGASFQALPDPAWVIPPDTMGAVGPEHVMTMLNSDVRIQDREGQILSTVSLYTFWTTGTGLSGDPFDPKLLYDATSGRWVATCDAVKPPSDSSVFFAISETSDPTGDWTFYGFDADATNATWADYPGFGLNSNWIAITNNMFGTSDGNYYGVKMWVIDKPSALAGGALRVSVFNTGFDRIFDFTGFTMLPCVTHDTDQPALFLLDNDWIDDDDTPPHPSLAAHGHAGFAQMVGPARLDLRRFGHVPRSQPLQLLPAQRDTEGGQPPRLDQRPAPDERGLPQRAGVGDAHRRPAGRHALRPRGDLLVPAQRGRLAAADRTVRRPRRRAQPIPLLPQHRRELRRRRVHRLLPQRFDALRGGLLYLPPGGRPARHDARYRRRQGGRKPVLQGLRLRQKPLGRLQRHGGRSDRRPHLLDDPGVRRAARRRQR